MKNSKRFISLFLVLCLVVGFMPVSVIADVIQTNEEIISSEQHETGEIEIEVDENGDESIPQLKEEGNTVESDDESQKVGSWDEYVENRDEDIDALDFNEYSYGENPQLSIDMSDQAGSSSLLYYRGMANQRVTRYTILVLDTSGSMSGTPMTRAKAAANKFVDQVLKADGDNYVAVVSFSTNAQRVCDFTNDSSKLTNNIDRLYASGSTNQNAALILADSLFKDIEEPNAIKNILLLSDGLPETGESTYIGPYTYNDYSYGYGYANAAYRTAKGLHDNYYIYSLGFFHGLSGSNLNFGRRFMSDLQNAGYYDVVNVDDLDFAFGEIADDIVKKSGTFRYPGKGRDYSSVYYYDNNYFSGSSDTYNPHLATMSLCLELSAWASEDVGDSYANKSINAQNLLTEIGFSDFETNYGFKEKPTKDSIGAVAANKKITVNKKEYTLIALAVRGGGYESEWASNFTIGEDGFHQGFTQARNQVLAFLKDYISRNDISGDIKLWITGYSRGAATANMVAGAINEGEGFTNCTLQPSDMYAYTFETPAGALKSDIDNNRNRNIFNIINSSDLVTKVAPARWSFVRYGVDRLLPSKPLSNDKWYNSEREGMLRKYYDLEGTASYTVDNFVMRKIHVDGWKFLPGGEPFISITDDNDNKKTQGIFLDDYINNRLVGEFIKTRSNYVARLQDGVRELCATFFGSDRIKTEKLILSLKEKFSNNWGEIIKPLYWNNPFKSAADKEKEAYEVVARFLFECLDEVGIDYNKSVLDKAIVNLADLIVALALNHPNLGLTLFHNLDGIGSAHYPELCLAWLQSMDTNYTSGGSTSFSSSSYRIIRINCPVDVQVYNDYNELVAEIISDKPQDVGSSIVSLINEDGEKVVYLPAEADYSIDITPTDNGTMSFSIGEYNILAGDNTRIINYYDIPIEKNMPLMANIPSFNNNDLEDDIENGSSTLYSLYNANNEKIQPDDEYSGDDATSAYFSVNVSSSDPTHGFVTGEGIRQLGNYAQVTANAYRGFNFDGWYNEGEKVSTDSNYRFRVESDTELVARFSATSHNLNISAGAGGSITKGQGGNYETGTFIDIAATPNTGYRFLYWTSSNGGVFKNANDASTIFAMSGDNTTITANFGPIGSPEQPKDTQEQQYTRSKALSSWDIILNKINSAKDGETIIIEMKNETVLPTSILNAIRDRDITIILKFNTFSWSINGKSVNNIPSSKSGYDMEIMEITDFTLSSLADNKDIVAIKLAYEDIFPFDAILSLKIGKKYSGLQIFMNRYNERLKGLEYIGVSNVDNNGEVRYRVNQGTKYIITTMVAKDTYIADNPMLDLLGSSPQLGSRLYSYIPYIVDGDNLSIVKFSGIVDNLVAFNAPRSGLYKYNYNEKNFMDIANHWAENAIDFVTSRELFAGVGNNKFEPNTGMTRAMFAAVLSNLDEADLTQYTVSVFPDVSMDTWYGKAVAWAADQSIIGGYGNGLYGPNDLITREQMAVMLSNYMKYKGLVLPRIASEPFADSELVSRWAKEAVGDMRSYGLITGIGNNLYSPQNTANRASVAHIFMNIINNGTKGH